MLKEDMILPNEIKALVKKYQGFSLLYFAEKTSTIVEGVDMYETI